MKTEEEVIMMLETINQLPTGYTVHALQAILNLILERDADEDITYLEEFSSEHMEVIE